MKQESPPIEHENPFKQQLPGFIDYTTPSGIRDKAALEHRYEMLRDEGSYADQDKMKVHKRPDSLIVLPTLLNPDARLKLKWEEEWQKSRNNQGKMKHQQRTSQSTKLHTKHMKVRYCTTILPEGQRVDGKT